MPQIHEIPFNVEAEEALLGAILIMPSLFPTIRLHPKEFYIERHQWIWRSMIQLQNANHAIDIISVADQLKSEGNLEEAGGHPALMRMVNQTPSSLHATEYAQIIHNKYRRREMIAVAQELSVSAFDEKSDLEESLAKASDKLLAGVKTEHEMIHISEAIQPVIDTVVEASKTNAETWGIPTGFVDLDRMTGGLSGLWYLAGAPGIGKSILMLQIVIEAAKNGYAGAIFTLEMSTLAQMIRALSAEAEIPTRDLRRGKLTESDWGSFYKACGDMSKLPIYICDEPALSTPQLRAHLLRLKAKVDLKLFALDYLYLMTDEEQAQATERTEILSKRIKAVQRQVDIPGLTVNSVTKEGMNGHSDMTNLRGSGQLIHDADVVLFIEKHEIYDSMRTVSLKKGRDIEELGKVDLVKMASWPLFKDAERRVPK